MRSSGDSLDAGRTASAESPKHRPSTHGSLTSLSVSLMMRLGRDMAGQGLLRWQKLGYVGAGAVGVERVEPVVLAGVWGDFLGVSVGRGRSKTSMSDPGPLLRHAGRGRRGVGWPVRRHS